VACSDTLAWFNWRGQLGLALAIINSLCAPRIFPALVRREFSCQGQDMLLDYFLTVLAVLRPVEALVQKDGVVKNFNLNCVNCH
jgi:hypothetical protein